jgi:hypothetical protein
MAGRVVRLVLDLVMVHRLVGLRTASALRSAAPSLLSAGVMAVALMALDRLAETLPPVSRLTLLVVAGALIYIATLAAADRGLHRELRDLVRAAIGGRLQRGPVVELEGAEAP